MLMIEISFAIYFFFSNGESYFKDNPKKIVTVKVEGLHRRVKSFSFIPEKTTKKGDYHGDHHQNMRHNIIHQTTMKDVLTDILNSV